MTQNRISAKHADPPSAKVSNWSAGERISAASAGPHSGVGWRGSSSGRPESRALRHDGLRHGSKSPKPEPPRGPNWHWCHTVQLPPRKRPTGSIDYGEETILDRISHRSAIGTLLVGYARVSTAEQNPERQVRALEEHGCGRIFTDRCFGRGASRPQLDAALESLREGDSLVAWRFDRLGRSVRHLLELSGKVDDRGCQLVSLTEAIDTGTPGGRVVFAVFSAVAAFEADLMRERTVEAARTARANGNRWGRRSKFHDPETVRAAKAMLADPAVPTVAVARHFGVTKNTIYGWFPGADPQAFGTGRNGKERSQ